jgi:hypothetical protein
MAEGAQIVAAEPAVAAQFFGRFFSKRNHGRFSNGDFGMDDFLMGDFPCHHYCWA